MSKWTPAELKVLKNTSLDRFEVAARVNRTPNAVFCKRQDMGLSGKCKEAVGAARKAPVKDANFQENRKEEGEKYWKTQYAKLSREYQDALKEVALVDRLITGISCLAPLSYSPAPSITLPPRHKKATPESAVLLFSDTHIGKVTRMSQTLGFSQYDFPTFLARLKFLQDTIISMLRDHTTAPIREMIIAMLGDMLDGALVHAVEAGQVNVLFNQFYQAAHAIAQFLRALAAYVPVIHIETCVGNHTRWQTQKKMPSTNRHSNLDMFLYAMLEGLTKDIPNIKWNLTEQPFAIFTVEGHTFHASHGDHWHGGDKAMGIPLHAMARQINATTQLFHKHETAVPQYYVTGHLHRPISLPTGLGDITVNGGFPGLDGYALNGNFNPVDPCQVFFRVHPKYGKIAEYKVQLKHAEVGGPTYQLPSRFPCL